MKVNQYRLVGLCLTAVTISLYAYIMIGLVWGIGVFLFWIILYLILRFVSIKDAPFWVMLALVYLTIFISVNYLYQQQESSISHSSVPTISAISATPLPQITTLE